MQMPIKKMLFLFFFQDENDVEESFGAWLQLCDIQKLSFFNIAIEMIIVFGIENDVVYFVSPTDKKRKQRQTRNYIPSSCMTDFVKVSMQSL